MDRHRNHVVAQGRASAEIQAMGGDATLPRRKLRRAILALAQDDRESYLEVIEEVDELVKVARAQRVQAIELGAEGVEGPLRQGLADALKTGDFISGHFLLIASQETSFRDAPTPAASAFQDSRKITQLKEVLAQIGSMVERAEEHGLDVTTAAEGLAAAKRLAESEDYAAALIRGRQAYHLLRTLRTQAETIEEEPDASAAPEPDEKFKEGPDEEEAKALGVVDEDTLLWCLECGSVQVGMDIRTETSVASVAMRRSLGYFPEPIGLERVPVRRAGRDFLPFPFSFPRDAGGGPIRRRGDLDPRVWDPPSPQEGDGALRPRSRRGRGDAPPVAGVHRRRSGRARNRDPALPVSLHGGRKAVSQPARLA